MIASLGHPAYDLYAAGDRPANFYTWGSMGLASSIGLGLAMVQPDLRVFVVDGDGSLLMNLGSLATIGWVRPANLVVIVWDNQVTARRVDRTPPPRMAPTWKRPPARWASRRRHGEHRDGVRRGDRAS